MALLFSRSVCSLHHHTYPATQVGLKAALDAAPDFALCCGPAPEHLDLSAPPQFAFNTLSRVTPVAHGVCNVVKRVCIIGTSVIFFGNKMSDQTKLGTVIALIGALHFFQDVRSLGRIFRIASVDLLLE